MKKHWLVRNVDRMVEAGKKACCATMQFNIFVRSWAVKESVCPWCKTKRLKDVKDNINSQDPGCLLQDLKTILEGK